MNIKRAKDEIKNTIQAYLLKNDAGEYMIPAIRQRPMLLMGPPGIGKTQIMEQIARECKIGLVAYTITHHTRQSAVGLPIIQEEKFDGETYSVTEYTMSEIIASVYRKIRDLGLKEGILFIDEINCVSETLAPTMLQFLQCKTFGNQKIPEGWLIVAAGNPPEYNKSVRDFDMVTLDRVRRMDIEADYTVWREYAKSQKVHPALLSYLNLRPQNFYRVEADVDGMQFVTARGWEDLSNLMEAYENLSIPIDEEIIHEFLRHEDVARDVAAYLDLYYKYQDDYGVAEILQGKVKASVYARLLTAAFDERLSLVNLLLSGLDKQFMQVSVDKYVTDMWYGFLKNYKQLLEADREVENQEVKQKSDGIQLYNQLATQLEDQLNQELHDGFLTKTEERNKKQTLNLIKASAPTKHYEAQNPAMKGADIANSAAITSNAADQYFADALAPFRTQQKQLETREAQALQSLEYAFDFLEKAELTDQEMVVFVTELTMTSESAAFLSENTCDRYLAYSKRLLVGTRRAELLAELDTDTVRSDEHSREF